MLLSSPQRDGRRLRVKAKANAGFTLIEMLVVLAIIGMLVALVAPRVLSQLSGAKVKAAQIQIENFKSALDLYYMDVGHYPTTSQGLEALTVQPVDEAIWSGPYLKSGEVPRDPWNDVYVYRAPGDEGRPFEITSQGPPGESHDNKPREIKSW